MDEAFTVIGIRVSSFLDKQTGNPVEYARVYCTYSEDESTAGLACERFSVKPDKCINLNVGDLVSPIYNKYGKVSGFIVLSSEVA